MWLGAQDLIALDLGSAGRVLARPSGTEPKLKIYVDLNGAAGTDPEAAHRELTAQATAMAREVGEGLAV